MSKKLRVAIAGLGRMGKIREACVRKHPLLDLVAVCDTTPPDTQTIDVPACSDYRELLNFKPDIVFACTPNLFLPEITCFFLRNRIHVFCEKPPGRSKEDVERMINAEKEASGPKLKFGFNHRYHESIIEAKAFVDKGRLGKVMWMRGIYGKSGASDYEKSWRNKREISGGGILIDQGVHMVDLFRLFCGEFDEVHSFIGRRYWPVEVEDNAFALMRNKSGQVALLHSSATQWQHKFLLDIYLEKGYLSVSGIMSSTKTYGTETLKIARCLYDDKGYPLPNPEETITYYDEDKSWEAEIDEFVRCILSNQPIKVGFSYDAYKTMELIEKIYQSDPEWQKSQLASSPQKVK